MGVGGKERLVFLSDLFVSAGFFSAYTVLYIMNLGSHTFQT